jgi:hypothetical protein
MNIKTVITVIQEYSILFSECTPTPCFFGEVQKQKKKIFSEAVKPSISIWRGI